MPKKSTSYEHPNDPNAVVRQRRPVEDVRASLHNAGAERHKSDWMPANIRAVDAARAKGLDPTTSPAREAIPNIILRVLDGLKVQAGLTWDKPTSTWIPDHKDNTAPGKPAVSWARVGAHVQFCGHEGWFVADVYEIGDAIFVKGNPGISGSTINRDDMDTITHHITDMHPCYWNPNQGVFCVLKSNAKLIK